MYVEGLRIDAISDTHNLHTKFAMPGGDVLVHSGDATSMGTVSEVMAFLSWLEKQPYKHKIFVPGNHDWLFELNPALCQIECANRGIILLNDSGTEIEGIKFWGSPVQPEFCNWAFNRNQLEIEPHWDMIPLDTKVLITHGPPYGILDYVMRFEGPELLGCKALLAKIYQTQVKLHIYGHIHYAAGSKVVDGRLFVNAAAVGENYKPTIGNPKRIVVDSNGEFVMEEAILK